MPSIPGLPIITSITATDPTGTDAETVHFTVTFSETVTGVTANKFGLATTGTLMGASVTGVTPVAGSDGTSYVVTVSTGIGSGALDLQLINSNVYDTSGYAIGGAFQNLLGWSGPRFSLANPVAVGDINGDGTQDLMIGRTSTATSSYIEIRTNDGAGNFTRSTLPDPVVEEVIGSIRLADLDGDGKLDALLGNLTTRSLDVRLGDGNGGFAAPVKYGVGFGSYIKATADYNGDGKLDVLTGIANNSSLSLMFGNGDGSFGLSMAANVSAFDVIASEDFNGDGKIDLLAKNPSSSMVGLHLGNGDGTFQSPIDAGVAPVFFSSDFNGDGKLDIALGTGNSLAIRLGNGDGTFASPQTLLTPNAIKSGTAADVNGDGKMDILALGTNDFLSAFYGRGDGTFGAAMTVRLTQSSGAMTVGNFNGDGKADVLVGYYTPNSFVGEAILIGGPSPTVTGYTINRAALAMKGSDVTLGTDGRNYINAAHFDGAMTLSGVSSAGDVIKVTDFSSGTVVGTVTAGANGAWSLNVSALHDGLTYTYVASTTDSAGNPVTGPALTFTVDAAAPIVSITDIEPVDASGKFNVIGTIGQGDAGTTVTVNQQAGSTLGATVSGADGSWVLANQTLAAGQAVLSGQATDAAGNTGSGSIDLRIASSQTVNTNSTSKFIIIGAYGLKVNAAGTVTGARVAPNASILINAGGTAIDTKLWSGASELNYGASIGSVVLSGAKQSVYGTATGATIADGGYHDIYGTAVDTVLSGDEQVGAGGTAIHTSIEASGRQYVAAGGVSQNTVVHGLQYVAAGGNDTSATIDGGTQYLLGTATSATVINGGTQLHFGSSAGTIVGNGGIQQVLAGTAYGAQVAAGGYQGVTNATVLNTLLAGNQQVRDNGVAIATTIEAGGRQYVGAGGSSSYTVITTGGLQYIDAGASDSLATIDGGFQYVVGTATGTTVRGGGEQDVAAGGTAINTHLADGSEHVMAGGLAQGIDFGGDAAATLVLDTPEGLAGSIANWGDGDRIDFRNTTISSFDIDSSNHLTIVTSGGDIYSWDLLTQYSASSFVLAPDGSGGTMLSYEPPQALLAAA